jgi:hypothetical protein
VSNGLRRAKLYHIDVSRIADPFIGMNEMNVEWIGEKSWVYKTSLSSPTIPFGSKCVLVFEGLDTIAVSAIPLRLRSNSKISSVSN